MLRKIKNTTNLILLFLFLLQIVSAANNIIITEVYYDAVNESGSEFVELFNPTNQSIDIGNYLISTETSSADATIPPNTTITPGSYYLVADAGWRAGKDNSTWKNADYEEAITLTNIDAGVALVHNNQTIDAVGWGNPLNINLGLYEGIPAVAVTEGLSLQRKKDANGSYIDTNNNSADFIATYPYPENSSSATAQEASSNITAVAIIGSSAPVIDLISIITDDDTKQGIQIMPVPKNGKEANVTVQVTDFNGYGDVSEVSAQSESKNYSLQFMASINATTALFSGLFNISYYLAPGNHSINVSAKDASNLTDYSTAEFEYMGLVALEFDASSITFSAVPGQSFDVTGDSDMGTPNRPTIRNIGNTNLNLRLSGSNLAKGQSSIGADNILYSFSGSDFNSSVSGALSASGQDVNLNLGRGQNAVKEMSFRLSVPLGVQTGSYFGSISVTGVGN